MLGSIAKIKHPDMCVLLVLGFPETYHDACLWTLMMTYEMLYLVHYG